MSSLRIIIVRHTNKSPTSGRNASPLGYVRARKIVDFFHGYLGDSVKYLYASNHSDRCEDRSKREVELLIPTSEYYNLPILTPYCVAEYALLAKELLSLRGTVIVAWEHRHVPLLLRHLFIHPPPPDWPESDANRFDLVFDVKVQFVPNGMVTDMFVTTEGLGLPGDSLSIPSSYEKYNVTDGYFTSTILQRKQTCVMQ